MKKCFITIETGLVNCPEMNATTTNIYIFFAFALNESAVLNALQFPMQNIYQSGDQSRADGRSNVITS